MIQGPDTDLCSSQSELSRSRILPAGGGTIGSEPPLEDKPAPRVGVASVSTDFPGPWAGRRVVKATVAWGAA